MLGAVFMVRFEEMVTSILVNVLNINKRTYLKLKLWRYLCEKGQKNESKELNRKLLT